MWIPRLTAAAVILLSGSPAPLPPMEFKSEHVAGRQFLGIDRTGDGRIIEVLGDLSTADRIVVLVPGVDTTLSNFDTGLGGVLRRSPAHQARVLKERLPDNVAVIAWLGYDPPEGVWPDAVHADRAIAGAVELERFLASLRPQATVVLIGHSYGTVVIAHTTLGPQVTDIVALGSPGMGALSTNARVWVALAPTDWMRKIPRVSIAGLGHGSLPDDYTALPTDGVAGHDWYLVPGSATLDAIVALTTVAR